MEEKIPQTPQTPTEPSEKERTELETELAAMREELGALRREKAAFESAKEFARLFPGEDENALPPEVREQVESGCPLTAAYALYLRREEIRKAEAEAQSAIAAAKSSGSVRGSDGPAEFTLAEISAMTPVEVRRHYDDVIRSLGNSGKKRKN